MRKVLVSVSHYDTLCREAWDYMERNGCQIIFDPDKTFPAYTTEEVEALPDRAEIAAALIGMDDFRDERKYRALPNLKAVVKFGVGVDNIDAGLAEKYGVKVLNAPGQNANAVAELTVGFMIMLMRRITELHREVEQGLWPRFMGNELRGKTVGLLGFGAIARLTAEKLRCFGVKVTAYDLYPDEEKAKALGVKMTTREEVIRNSDIVSIHIPATPETYHLFDRERISEMKDGAVLINPARGALVDLDALAEALQSGKLAGAALDAFEEEPLPRDAQILQCKNVVLTPHTGGETREAYYHLSMTTAEDIVRVLRGEGPVFGVDRR